MRSRQTDWACRKLSSWSGLRWLSYEGPSVVTSVKDRLADRDAWAERPNFVVALDGEPIARASAHGGWVEWYPCAD